MSEPFLWSLFAPFGLKPITNVEAQNWVNRVTAVLESHFHGTRPTILGDDDLVFHCPNGHEGNEFKAQEWRDGTIVNLADLGTPPPGVPRQTLEFLRTDCKTLGLDGIKW